MTLAEERLLDLRLAWQACRAKDKELTQQLRALSKTEQALVAELAPLLCGMPVGTVFTIPAPHDPQGTWKVLSHRMHDEHYIELCCRRVRKDGTEGTQETIIPCQRAQRLMHKENRDAHP